MLRNASAGTCKTNHPLYLVLPVAGSESLLARKRVAPGTRNGNTAPTADDDPKTHRFPHPCTVRIAEYSATTGGVGLLGWRPEAICGSMEAFKEALRSNAWASYVIAPVSHTLLWLGLCKTQKGSGVPLQLQIFHFVLSTGRVRAARHTSHSMRAHPRSLLLSLCVFLPCASKHAVIQLNHIWRK